MKNKLVSIVVSAYNEQDNVAELYKELQKNLQKTKNVDFELIYVDDGSSDKTYVNCLALQKKDERVKIVKLKRNFGHEIAMTAGMDYAKGDAVIFMDADLQHPPLYIPQMIELWQQGKEIVLTKRVDNVATSGLYKFCAKTFYFILNKLSDTKVLESAPDFRLLDRKYVDFLKGFNEQDRLFRGLLSWVLPKATYLGLLSAFVAVLLGIYVFAEHFLMHNPTPGYATIVVSVVFLGAVQLICLGIIGEYIGKIHMEVKKRPLYMADYIEKTAKRGRKNAEKDI